MTIIVGEVKDGGFLVCHEGILKVFDSSTLSHLGVGASQAVVLGNVGVGVSQAVVLENEAKYSKPYCKRDLGKVLTKAGRLSRRSVFPYVFTKVNQGSMTAISNGFLLFGDEASSAFGDMLVMSGMHLDLQEGDYRDYAFVYFPKIGFSFIIPTVILPLLSSSYRIASGYNSSYETGSSAGLVFLNNDSVQVMDPAVLNMLNIGNDFLDKAATIFRLYVSYRRFCEYNMTSLYKVLPNAPALSRNSHTVVIKGKANVMSGVYTDVQESIIRAYKQGIGWCDEVSEPFAMVSKVSSKYIILVKVHHDLFDAISRREASKIATYLKTGRVTPENSDFSAIVIHSDGRNFKVGACATERFVRKGYAVNLDPDLMPRIRGVIGEAYSKYLAMNS